MIANTPEPPYYAVIFTTIKSGDLTGYDEMNARMFELAQQQEGYLGIESGRGELSVSVTYGDRRRYSRRKAHAGAPAAQEKGYRSMVKGLLPRVALVERDNFYERMT